MDSLGASRSRLFAAVESAIESGQRAWKDRLSGQTGLFLMMEEEHPDPPLPKVPDWTPQEQLNGEKETLGFYVTGHPLEQHRDKISELATHTTGDLEGLARGVEVKLCGIITGLQRKRNKEGKPWASMQLEDLSGAVEAMVFSNNYDALQQFLEEDKAVMARAMVLPEDNAPSKLSIQDIVPLDLASVTYPSLISIKVYLNSATGEKAQALRQLIAGKPGATDVRLRLEKARDFSLILDLSEKVRPDKEFCREVERICGSEAMEILAS
jgi:DNA polymerase-3 subunit alpha